MNDRGSLTACADAVSEDLEAAVRLAKHDEQEVMHALQAARQALSRAHRTGGCWADSVRWQTEQRLNRPFEECDAVVLADPKYRAAMARARALDDAMSALANAANAWDVE